LYTFVTLETSACSPNLASSFKWQPDTDRFLRVSTLAEKAPSWNSQQLLSGLEMFRKMPKHVKITVIDIQNYHSFIVSPPKKHGLGKQIINSAEIPPIET
jgi:hypothetical protein